VLVDNALLTLGGIALGAILAFLGHLWSIKIQSRHTNGRADSAAYSLERIELSKRYQDILATQEQRLTRAETDSRSAWETIREMQEALYRSEQLHREDAAKIELLRRQNEQLAEQVAQQARQLLALQKTINNFQNPC
jgi:hypothetical protein